MSLPGGEGRLLEDWMTARARAETKRLSYFNYIVNSSVGPLDPSAGAAQVGVFSPLSARSSARLLQNPPVGAPQLGRTDP